MSYGFLYLSILIGSIAAMNPAFSQSPLRSLYDQGVKHGIDGQFDIAKTVFQSILNQDSTYIPAKLNLKIVENVLAGKLAEQAAKYYFMAINFGNRDDFDNKLDYLTRAIEISPDFALAYNDRAIAYARKNLYEQAIKDYDSALKISPDLPEAYMNKALACDKINHPVDALEAYKSFLKYAGDRNDHYTFYATNRVKELENFLQMQK
jgi:tetratricopeptide (TPR) repeat protein